MYDMRFASKVERLRELRGIGSQAALGELIGVPQPVISEWAKKNPDQIRLNLTQLHALGRVLGVSLEYLADDAADTPPPPAVTDDERTVLDVLRAIGLPKDEAIRRLMGAAAIPPVRAPSPESRVDHFNDRDAAALSPAADPAHRSPAPTPTPHRTRKRRA